MIEIIPGLALEEGELEESFIRSSGPGGQNVNKLATACQLRFDVRHSPSLPIAIRVRAERLAGSRLTQAGVIVITAQRFRTQERNRADALERLLDILRRAAAPVIPRRPTKPTLASKVRRRRAKARRGEVKSLRAKPRSDD